MGRFGDVLAIIYGASEPYDTLCASLRHTFTAPMAKGARQGSGVIGKRRVATDAASLINEIVYSVRIARPERMRVEEEIRYEGHVENSLTIINGAEGVRKDHHGHVEVFSNDTKRPGISRVARHFDRDRR